MANSFQLEYFSNKLKKYLAAAQTEDFYKLIWAVDAIQSERIEAARHYFSFPEEAATSDIRSSYFAHKWILEDLCNEHFSIRQRKRRGNKHRYLNCTNFNTAARLVNALKSLQNAEDGIILAKADVLDEIPKIAVKQFDWQRGYFSKDGFYRAAFIFGGPITQRHFHETVGVSFEQYTKIGFGIYGFFHNNHTMGPAVDLRQLEITRDEFDQVLERWSRAPHELLKLSAPLKRKYPYSQARPSLLRQFPIIALEAQPKNYICPLPELIAWKITDGLYYETVGDNGDVRREIGDRFERYCEALFLEYRSGYGVKTEYEYRIPGKNQRTPDLLLKRDCAVELIVECKFKRLTFDATFISKDNIEDTPGMGELAKGVMQIWRFISHGRLGHLPDETIVENPIGVVLTMDPWLVMSAKRYQVILDMASRLAADQGLDLVDADKIPIAFCSVKDLEALLRRSNAQSLFDTFEMAANSEYAGWHLANLHDRATPDLNIRKEFPFHGQFGEMLPWWPELQQAPD